MQRASFPKVIIAIARTQEERVQAIEFIDSAMWERFGGKAPPTRGIILTALVRGDIVGSIALEGSRDDTPFPIEEHYNFETEIVPFPCARTFIVQGSRWVATKSGVSSIILRAALSIAYHLGKQYMFVEAKPYGIRRVGELGIVCREMTGATLCAERIQKMIGEEGMPYYRTEPLPRPYLIDIEPTIDGTWC